MSRKRVKVSGGIQQFNENAMRNNVNILEYRFVVFRWTYYPGLSLFSRTCQAAVSGCAAGIIGLTGIYGFIFYFLCSLLQTLLWYCKCGLDCGTYFGDRLILFSHSLVGGLFTYILFWTFLYGMVHVY